MSEPDDIVRLIRQHDANGKFNASPYQAAELVRLYGEMRYTQGVSHGLERPKPLPPPFLGYEDDWA
jgi:hypothetical protein